MNGLPLKAINLDIKVTEKESLQPKGILPPSFPLPPSGLRPCTSKIKITITIFNPLHPNNLHCSLYISSGTDNESLFDNQELAELVIIAFIFLTFTIWF